jgi:hypothetical protein
MGAMKNTGGAGFGPTMTPAAPGNLVQSSTMTSGGEGTTTVAADPNAHTTQSYDPTTNTLTTTTVDPVTGAVWYDPGKEGLGLGTVTCAHRAHGVLVLLQPAKLLKCTRPGP